MRAFYCFTAIAFLAAISIPQTIKLTGTIYDPTGAIVIGAKVEGRSASKFSNSAITNNEGKFELALPTGLYELNISATGFLSIEYKEYFVVNTFDRAMRMDFVMFGSKWHEPCGVSGANCLPKEDLIKSYKVSYSPTLKEIRDRFTDSKSPKH